MAKRKHKRKLGSPPSVHEERLNRALDRAEELAEYGRSELARGQCAEAAAAIFGAHGAMAAAYTHSSSAGDGRNGRIQDVGSTVDITRSKFVRMCVTPTAHPDLPRRRHHRRLYEE